MLDCQLALLEDALPAYLHLGEVAKPQGSRHPEIAPFQVYTTQDSYIVIAAGNDHLFGLLARALARPDLAENPNYATNALRHANVEKLEADMEATLRTAPTARWLEVLNAAGVPCGPVNTVAELTPYRPALDITGADIYPVSYPPGSHAGAKNTDLSVVGDVTRTLRAAAGPKPVWMTLQIAWSGVAPTTSRPDRVPRFPSLHDERFMTYQAIANGARGLNYFGGHLTQVATPQDAELG